MFGKTDPTSERFDALMDELSSLKADVAELRGDRDGHSRAGKLENELSKIKRELTDKQIEFDREQEKWDRERREVEHMVGLQRKRGEFETEAAGREAVLSVREENLKAQQDRFDEHVKFIEEALRPAVRVAQRTHGEVPRADAYDQAAHHGRRRQRRNRGGLMAFGDPWPYWTQNDYLNQQAGQTNIPYTWTDSTTANIQPVVIPALVPPAPEPVDDSPLAWLRGQVAEITELARAA